MTFETTFPDSFLWGAATASYQIEGAVAEDGRLPSIWDTFCAEPGKVLGGESGEVACEHYHRMPQDVALMKELGLDAYRFSVAWPRVIPTGTGAVNQVGLDFYSRLVDTLLDSGIRPFVTLYHWDLPQTLGDRGGWLNRDVKDWFADYASVVVAALGDRVKNWTTLNEPWCSSLLSHSLGHHAPGHTDQVEGLVSAHHLMLAHGTAVPVIREACPDAEVSITLNPTQVIGPDDPTDADRDAVQRADDVLNGIFFGPLFHGAYPATLLENTAHLTDHAHIRDGDLEVMRAPLDNLGVNNYFPTRVKHTDGATHPLPGGEGLEETAPHEPLTDMGWEVNADAHHDILMRSWQESALPIYVTENGSAWPDVLETGPEGDAVHDPDRTAYLHGHLDAVRRAIDDGADVRGYFAWSLMDNFEWAFGYSKRFGIVHVDYDTQKRTVKDSGREYARIIATHRTP
jgi:beta-glucosidase